MGASSNSVARSKSRGVEKRPLNVAGVSDPGTFVLLFEKDDTGLICAEAAAALDAAGESEGNDVRLWLSEGEFASSFFSNAVDVSLVDSRRRLEGEERGEEQRRPASLGPGAGDEAKSGIVFQNG